ncbi:MAG TPA: alpha/beta hydrolase domain-containing protein [Chloroflexota bacterium]
MALTRLDLARRPLLDGRPFGEAGAYEELTGEAEFAADPRHPLNSVIADLSLAPRDAQGCVRFDADVRILRPVKPLAGPRGLFLDVVNRGTSIFSRMLEPGPMGPSTAISEGFLLRRGFTIVSCGWQHDMPRGQGRFGLTAPLAVCAGQALTGEVTTTRQIDLATDTLLLDSDYRPLDPTAGTLTERDDPGGPGRLIARERWRFVADPWRVHSLDGFVPGKTYDFTYTAEGAPVTGIGLLGLRDLVSHLRQTDGLDFAIALGASQTGRLLRQMVHLGLCEGEDGRLVLDGVLAIAAGARMTEANWRFGQPSAQGAKSAVFPYTDAIQMEPRTGQTDGLMRRALERGRLPRVMHLNTSSEYCSSAAITHISAALAHITADGQADVDVPDNVRIYHCASTQHAPSPLPLGTGDVPTGRGVYYPNTIDYKPFVRAAVDRLSAWVTRGVDPPPSRYPRLGDGSLGRDLRPAVDADGNEIGGVRHPDVSVPLATYSGSNPRHPSTGGAHLLVRATGATIPFARTAGERAARRDTRLSIAERYPSREVFLERIGGAATALVVEGYLLADDVEPLVGASARRWDEFMGLDSPLPRA